ncbi:cobyrinate a,c-diamide synthase [Ktedonosporobacter rubrisoli]|uniref:Cobyrinate a,c-diamide synthase n=1 Tax=Ktedonosporobacter rubrisoli TaxID=2509675 RepID=A0A4P6JQS1_KTERU|nr:cobyrinate a,c-diamide synthase [Ktedonosporobacter rubrisoli]QBD77613.1 cobyrinate a,c-diamide synthase [Ktedonosporobacter rubrisoli]
MSLPRIVIAGPASGVGKTTIASAFIADLLSQGLKVQPFKVGPDYIDPAHLATTAAQACYNLDTWMMPPARMLSIFQRHASRADIAVIEGVMGLYDGARSTDEQGSTAEIAKLLRAPVILVIDAGAMARSAAALVLGFQKLDPGVHLIGVIANRVGGAGHARLLQEAIEAETGIPLLGYLSRARAPFIPERHLGLIPAAEHSLSSAQLAALTEQFRQTCDSQRILQLALKAPELLQPEENAAEGIEALSGPPIRIALAQDEAFNFYYPDTLDLLRDNGAELIPFSPLHDQELPEGIAGIYIGGGFPEVHARALAANIRLRTALASLLAHNIPCYAECGGLMYLCQSIHTASGEVFPMVGALDRQSLMSQTTGKLTLGYREARALRDTLLMRKGEVIRGHEFHYSVLERSATQEEAAYTFTGHEQVEGFARGNLLASYVHLSFSSFPYAAQRFVTAARSWLASNFSPPLPANDQTHR